MDAVSEHILTDNGDISYQLFVDEKDSDKYYLYIGRTREMYPYTLEEWEELTYGISES